MGSLAHNSNSQIKNLFTNKSPEYAREYKREWQYIYGINKTCGNFLKKLDKINFYTRHASFELECEREEIFFSPSAKGLLDIINTFFKYYNRGDIKVSGKYLKEYDVYEINDLYSRLYSIIGVMEDCEYFQDFFDNFITFHFTCKFTRIDYLALDESEIEKPDYIDEDGTAYYFGSDVSEEPKNDFINIFKRCCRDTEDSDSDSDSDSE